MDLLAGYCSSSSSSSSLPSAEARHHPHHSRPINRHHDPLRARDAQDALHVDASDHPFGAGSDGHCSESTAPPNGRVGNCSGGINVNDGQQQDCARAHTRNRRHGSIKRQTEQSIGVEIVQSDEMPRIAKRRRKHVLADVAKGQKQYASRVIIARCDNNGNGEGDNGNDAISVSNQPKFKRSHPHWEGRWVGHIHLPMPPLESLDYLLESSNDEVTGMNHAQGSSHTDESSSSSDDGSSCEDEEDEMPSSRTFLPAARKLIHLWARVLGNVHADYLREGHNNNIANDSTTNCDHKDGINATIVILPHIPMRPIERTVKSSTPQRASEESKSARATSSLHISLARPIYLPAPSVNPFLSDIEKSIRTVLSIAGGRGGTKSRNGRILQFQPQNATIFTNDEQSRSFLAIPVSEESSRWVKRILLPPIDAAMLRFGLETYYSTEEEGSILHVSIASVKGNVIPQMLCERRAANHRGVDGGKGENEVRSIPLFDRGGPVNLKTLPGHNIPIRVNQVQCEFGKAKQLNISF